MVDGPLPPPIQNAVFLEPAILIRFDPTTYVGLVDAGRDTRLVFDRRVPGWVTQRVYLFDVTYDDDLTTEVLVDPEFETVDAAREQAEFYAREIGRLPATLRKGVRTLVIHRGDESFGGSTGTVLVHTFRGETRFTQGVLEETLVHEATHAALDSLYRNSDGWLAAQAADNRFLTPHALENPTTEDIAASFLPYLALRYRRNRLSEAIADTIANAIPHRIAFFDSLPFERYPWD